MMLAGGLAAPAPGSREPLTPGWQLRAASPPREPRSQRLPGRARRCRTGTDAAFTFPKCRPRCAAPLLWDGLGHGGEPGSGQDGGDSWEVTSRAVPVPGHTGPHPKPSLLSAPQPCGRAGAALSPPPLGTQGDWSSAVPWQCQGSLTREVWAPCTRPGSGSTGGAGGGAQRWLRPGLCHWPCVTLPPQSPGLSPSLEGTRCDSRNRASIPEPKGSHHLHFQLPRAAHRMPGRPPARRSILLHHPGSGRGQGCTGAAAGNALLDPMAVNSPGEASAAPARHGSRSGSHDSGSG